MTPELHTYREIKQQPRVWLEAYRIIASRKEEIKSFTNKWLALGYEIVLTGAGTSAYIGDALETALHMTPFRGARAIATTDIITNPYMYFNKDSKVLLISFGRSGNSPESLGAVKAVNATAGSVAHIFITCNAEGQMALTKAPNILTILLPPETNDVSLAMTSSYSTMLLTCSMIANINRIEEQKAFIETLSSCLENAIAKNEDTIRSIASLDFKRAIFLGSGPVKGVAEECRLKLQELTDGQVMCAYDSFLGFRHGPKALVNPDSLMVYLLSPNSGVQRYEKDLINQVKSNNNVKASIVVCFSKEDIDPSCCSHCIEIGLPHDFPSCYGCVSYVFVGQLLGFFKSIERGLCPDSPSVSGNISRVVEGVTLYD